MNDKMKTLKRVQMYSFCMTEATLYLDTHPTCKQALEYFKQMRIAYEKAYDEYVRKYGPLKASDVDCDAQEWTWIKGPWPWMNEEVKKNVEL